MYYWQILQTDDTELLHKFMTVQKLTPSPNDWILQLNKDMEDLKIKITESEIKAISKDNFQRMIKRKVENLAVVYLNGQRKTKTKDISIKSFQPKEYILSKNLKVSEVQTLYKLRNSMIDVKENFQSGQENNMWCRTCYLFKETQQHLVQCSPIRDKLEGLVKFNQLDYNMIFKTVKSQEYFAKMYTLILDARRDIISSNSEDHQHDYSDAGGAPCCISLDEI